jgi:hypothetical protein
MLAQPIIPASGAGLPDNLKRLFSREIRPCSAQFPHGLLTENTEAVHHAIPHTNILGTWAHNVRPGTIDADHMIVMPTARMARLTLKEEPRQGPTTIAMALGSPRVPDGARTHRDDGGIRSGKPTARPPARLVWCRNCYRVRHGLSFLSRGCTRQPYTGLGTCVGSVGVCIHLPQTPKARRKPVRSSPQRRQDSCSGRCGIGYPPSAYGPCCDPSCTPHQQQCRGAGTSPAHAPTWGCQQC